MCSWCVCCGSPDISYTSSRMLKTGSVAFYCCDSNAENISSRPVALVCPCVSDAASGADSKSAGVLPSIKTDIVQHLGCLLTLCAVPTGPSPPVGEPVDSGRTISTQSYGWQCSGIANFLRALFTATAHGQASSPRPPPWRQFMIPPGLLVLRSFCSAQNIQVIFRRPSFTVVHSVSQEGLCQA